MDYKDLIEKEAKANADLFYQQLKDVKFSNYEYGFHDGVNSKISERIKIEYAISILHELMTDTPVGSNESKKIQNKIIELKNKADGKV